jgi:hypothetical protein
MAFSGGLMLMFISLLFVQGNVAFEVAWMLMGGSCILALLGHPKKIITRSSWFDSPSLWEGVRGDGVKKYWRSLSWDGPTDSVPGTLVARSDKQPGRLETQA